MALEGYSQLLNICRENVTFNHSFISIDEEANLEYTALLDNQINREHIRLLYQEQNISDYSNVIVISIGTSSTQVYDMYKVLDYYYIGSDAISNNPLQASMLLNNIYSSLFNSDDTLPYHVVICNSISYFISKSILLTKINQYNLNELCKEEDIQAINEFALVCNDYNFPTVIVGRESTNKLDNKWLRIKAQQVYPESSGYIVDFGGGGLDLHYYDHVLHQLNPIAKDKFLRNKQTEFLETIQTTNVTDTIDYILNFLIQNIKKHTNSLELNNNHQLVCYIYQTGNARQLHFTKQI